VKSWRARWISWRNARLSDPQFQRFAGDFPPFRGIARQSAARLFDLVAGFVYSQVLAACVGLKLLEILRAGPRDVDALALQVDVPAQAMSRLLRAAAALDLVEALGPDRYALGRQGAALLGNAGLTDMIAHHTYFYADLQNPVALLRRGHGESLSGYWPYATAKDPKSAANDAVAAYSALMTATQPAVAADILDAYPMRRHRRLMDVGGGEGAFLAAAGARWPHLKLTLFDLPAVGDRARGRLAAAGLESRATIVGGDFLRAPAPAGADLITLVRVLHDHDDAGAASILGAVRRALGPGGRLLIAEPMAKDGQATSVADAYFGLYFQAMGRGRARSPREIAGLLRQAGFRRAKMLRSRTPALLRVLIAPV
jgi:demethylspheroidene O-methyltransferase